MRGGQAFENIVIIVTGIGANSGFSAFITNTIPRLDLIEKGQCFPFYLYKKPGEDESNKKKKGTHGQLPLEQEQGEKIVIKGYQRREAITDSALTHFAKFYGTDGRNITKEDLFYYIYGLLHSTDYQCRFAHNLSKQLPHIPRVKTYADFCTFAAAGRNLADLHLNYETVDPHPVTFEKGDPNTTEIADPATFYRVEKMKHPKIPDSSTDTPKDANTKAPPTNKGTAKIDDKTRVIYNHNITIADIPPAAWDYVVNGKPALKWVMDRQAIRIDKASGIINDANLYALETMNDPAYPLKLFQRVITVALKTNQITNTLPPLDIEE